MGDRGEVIGGEGAGRVGCIDVRLGGDGCCEVEEDMMSAQLKRRPREPGES